MKHLDDTRASIATTISGDVPQLTCGRMSSAENSSTRSNSAPPSLRRERQWATAQIADGYLVDGHYPSRASASMPMLQSVIRLLMDDMFLPRFFVQSLRHKSAIRPSSAPMD
jgi:hypothetical protein